MLKLKTLTIKNVGRFVEQQTLSFDELGSLIQVDGKNNNTGGSSGSGKSTIFNALDYLFGVNDIPASTLQSRLTKEGIHVEGDFELKSQQLKIIRSKKGLSITLNGSTVSGSSKIAEEKLDEIIGMPRHIFRPLFHKRQKEGGFFLQLTPKEIHEFLTDCLGHTSLRDKVAIVENKARELEEKRSKLLTDLEVNRSALQATLAAQESLGHPPTPSVFTISPELISALEQKKEDAKLAVQSVLNRHRQESDELEKLRPAVTIEKFDRTTIEKYEKGLNILSSKLDELKSIERQRQNQANSNVHQLKMRQLELKNKIALLEKVKQEIEKSVLEVKAIKSGLCPTCDQGWITETARKKEQILIDKLKSLKAQLKEGEAAQEEIVKLEDSLKIALQEVMPRPIPEEHDIILKQTSLTNLLLEEAKKERAYYAEQNEKHSSLTKHFALQQNELKNKHNLELEQVRGQFELDRRAYEVALTSLKTYAEAKERYDLSIKKLQQQALEYGSRLAQNERQLSEVSAELSLATEAKRAINSYLSRSFDDALSYISDNATRIIRNIPNMANSTIQLIGIKETKDGKIKEEVSANISLDGDSNIPIKSLSGGERSSVDLAVDLSVLDFIESRSGLGLNLFILDEPFTGLDTQSIEMALEVLKSLNINKKLVIVDHNPMVKELVGNRLVVVRNNEFSNIEQ